MHDHDALFNIIDQQRRDQAVMEANDAARRQTAKGHDAKSVAAAETKLHGRATDQNDETRVPRPLALKRSGTVGTVTTSVWFVVSTVPGNATAPKASRERGGNAFMARATARPPSSSGRSSSSNPQAVPFSIPGARPPGRSLRLPPLRLEQMGIRLPQKQWFRKPILLRLQHLRRMITATRTFACQGRKWRQWIPGSLIPCGTMFPRALGRKMPHQCFTQLRCRCQHPRRSNALEIPATPCAHVSRSCSIAGLAILAWIRWTPNSSWRC